MLSVKTGKVLVDMRVLRSTGGPFNIRPAEWARDELQAALHNIIWEESGK
jgi:acyl-coenzyme A synthetase/AMP-(fatty) acid ligase